MVEPKAGVIILRRSAVVRFGTVVAVLAALGIGYVIGLAISSRPPLPNAVVTAAATTHGSSSAPTPGPVAVPAGVPTTASADPVPTVLSCKAGSKPQVRPTILYIGCASGGITMTDVTWSSWGSTQGSGSGNLHVNSCRPTCATGIIDSSPAFVVVSNPVGGVFQNVLATPPSGFVTPQSRSQPGSGWGSG